MTGSDLKKLREEFGLSAEEFARHLASIEAPITTGRSIYRLEARNRVPRWCVEALREYVGDDAFRRALADLGVADAEGAPTTERDFKVATRRGRRKTQKDGRRQRQEGDYIALLTALPLVTRTVPWITTFRDALREFLGDVDRVSINVNHNCDIHRTGQSHSDIIIAEHVESPTEGSTVFVTLEEDEGVPSERLLREFREKGYPLDSYHDTDRLTVRVLPNPASSTMSFQIDSQSHLPCRLEVFDALGTLRLQSTTAAGDGRLDVDVRTLEVGHYVYRLSNGGATATGAVVVTR